MPECDDFRRLSVIKEKKKINLAFALGPFRYAYLRHLGSHKFHDFLWIRFVALGSVSQLSVVSRAEGEHAAVESEQGGVIRPTRRVGHREIANTTNLKDY